MIRQLTSTAVSMMLLAVSVSAAKREVLQTDWRGFQEQVSARKLDGRSARVTVSGAGQIRAKVLQITDAALVVREDRDVKQWSTGDKRASIPKELVTAVRFEGRVGRGRAIGTVAGTSIGAALAGAIVSGTENGEGPYMILVPVFAAGAVSIGALIGYFSGRARDRHAPEFVLTH